MDDPIVYLNGKYKPKSEAVVPVDDRGFLFGDACYEATPIYDGACRTLTAHLDRLQRSLDAVRIDFDTTRLTAAHSELIDRNGLEDCSFGLVYAQVTRGVAERTHAFPAQPAEPTVYAFAKALAPITDPIFERGGSAISLADGRWKQPSIKTTNLLANVLAQQAAVEAGVSDVVLHCEGRVTEGTHNNVFAVIDGALVTPAADESILHGISREMVIEIAREQGVAVEERVIHLDELRTAAEVFFTGTTTEVRATVQLDGAAVGDGTVGPVTRELRDAFCERIRAL